MLVSELRELLKKYKEEDLRLLISEMYKSMPKKLREDKNIDELLQDVHRYLNIGKIEKTKGIQLDLKISKPEIEQFVDFAYKQYYFAPNSFVHKKERPKWRFKVKSYIKDLQGVLIESEDGKIATNLLIKLYEMLCYGCHYYIFNTDNPFRSVGIVQTEFLDIIIKRKFGNGISNESIRSMIDLVINSIVDRETLHSSLILTFVYNLKTPDSKEIAIKECYALKTEINKPITPTGKKTWQSNSYNYIREEKYNNLVEMVFRINMALCEYESAVLYFNDNYKDKDKEIKLYILLSLLLEYEQKRLWLREYDKSLNNGIVPRKTLQKTHEYILENGQMPESFVYS